MKNTVKVNGTEYRIVKRVNGNAEYSADNKKYDIYRIADGTQKRVTGCMTIAEGKELIEELEAERAELEKLI